MHNPLPSRGKSKHKFLRLARGPPSPPEITKEARVCRNTGGKKKDVKDAWNVERLNRFITFSSVITSFSKPHSPRLLGHSPDLTLLLEQLPSSDLPKNLTAMSACPFSWWWPLREVSSRARLLLQARFSSSWTSQLVSWRPSSCSLRLSIFFTVFLPDVTRIHHGPVLCLATQPRPALCDPVDCSPPGSSVHGDSPDKNTGVGVRAVLQGIFPAQGSTPGLLHCGGFFTS